MHQTELTSFFTNAEKTNEDEDATFLCFLVKQENKNTPQKEITSTYMIDSLSVMKMTNILILEITYILQFICRSVSNIL